MQPTAFVQVKASCYRFCWMQVALQYFQAFLDTMKREWFGIDRLRLDKFMLLVRKFIRQMLVLLSDADW